MAEPEDEIAVSRARDDLTGTRVGRYAIRSRLGAGGMGEVYLADDTQLKRAVALKRLAPQLRADPRYHQRFLKEAERASALNHPHIAGIYDVLEEKGELLLVMEYVEGGTLRQRLQDPVNSEEFLVLAVQCGQALVAAHEKGIVHGDIKPENIMLTGGGQVKILDFGVAKRLPLLDESGPTQTIEPKTNSISGTPAYMAPEVLLDKQTDGRADIFSLGVVFYEVLTRRHPFLADSFMATGNRILNEDPTPVIQFDSQVSPEVERIVFKMLAKKPAERYATAADLLVDLRALQRGVVIPGLRPTLPVRLDTRRRGVLLATAAGAVVLALLVAFLARERLPGRVSRARIESLAVLPLENLSRNPDQDYFADGMTDELITNLAKIGALRVISRTSVMQYKHALKPLPEVVRVLKVDAVVEGAVLRADDRVRITVELVDAATDRNLWAESYERDLRDVLALQREVAGAIANEIQIQLTPQEQARLWSARRVSSEVYDAYLKGRYYWNKRSEEGIKKAIEYFQQAIEKDPNYAPAYAGLADSYGSLQTYSDLPPKETMPKARAAAIRALELDARLAEAHTSLANVSLRYDLNWSETEREYRRAIELNPNYSTAHHWYAVYLAEVMGRVNEAVAEIKRAQELDPLALIITFNAGEISAYAHNYDQAIEQFNKIIELDPNFSLGHQGLAWTYEQVGRYEEAVIESQRAATLSGSRTSALAALGYAYAASGKKDEARKILGDLKERSKQRYVNPYYFAEVYTSLGGKDQAFMWLERAYQDRSSWLVYLKMEPTFNALHSDPRFQELMRRIGLPP